MKEPNPEPDSDLSTPLLHGTAEEIIKSLPPKAGDTFHSSTWFGNIFKSIVQCWVSVVDFFYWKLFTPAHPTLSALQVTRLETLQRRISVPYDANLPHHVNHLQRLWVAVFPNDPFPKPTLKSPKWKEMGWQGEDPGSDFRGGGFLSLEALVYFAETAPEEFGVLMMKQRGTERSSFEYPFAAAGVNLSFMLVDILNLRTRRSVGDEVNSSKSSKSRRMPSTPAGRGFLQLLQNDEMAFELLFIETFTVLDRIWLQQKASYLDFSCVLKEVRRAVEIVLGQRGLSSIDDLRAGLHSR